MSNLYESVIKVRVGDPPERRAADIAEGLDYAVCLLHDEYGWTAQQIMNTLDRVRDNVEWNYDNDTEE